MSSKKKKILVCAYSCEPGFSSEREIGWKWANLLSEKNEVHVLTRLSNKNTIQQYIEDNDIDLSLKFIYYDLPKWAKFWKKGERGLYLYYTLWQFGALLKSLKVHQKAKFDLVHYITFGSLLLPNFMFLMPTKFVLGPVGGGENVPLKFIGSFPIKGKITEIIRHVFQFMQHLNPLFYLQLYRSDKILVRTPETYKMIPSAFQKKTELMLETGVPEELLKFQKKSSEKRDLIKIITIGRFINSKINILTLQVILEFKKKYNQPFKFYLVGDGAQKIQLEEFCRRNDLTEVEFTGWVNRKDVIEHLSNSDIYFSTTFKEGGTWAFFEAVTLGIPVACLKISGPDMIVGDDCGYKIEPKNPNYVIENLSESLLALASNSELRNQFSSKAKKKLLENRTWDRMMQRVNQIYLELLDQK